MPASRRDLQAEALRAGPVPRHVAVIMDGNGRWAARRHLPRIEGHRAGARSVRAALETSILLGVRHLTLFTFSLENWGRPPGEVAELMKMLRAHLLRERDRMLREGVRLLAVGELHRLPADVLETLGELQAATAAGRTLDLVLALSYGGRQEMSSAALAAAAESRRTGAPVDRSCLERHLSTGMLPPVDLLVRTSGERRLSNFLLWKAAGARLHFTDTLWPDFRKAQYYDAVRAWQEGQARGERLGAA